MRRKKQVFGWLLAAALLLLAIFSLLPRHREAWDAKPNLMVEGTVYWSPPFQYIHVRPEAAVALGTIRSQTDGIAEENFQANGEKVGTAVYQDPAALNEIWCGNSLYVTADTTESEYRLH